VKRGQACRSTAKDGKTDPGHGPGTTSGEKRMSITTAQVRDIRTEFAKLKSVKVTLDGNRSLTVKDAVFALAPILERMKKRGFDTQELAEKLQEKGITIKAPTLAKYLIEFRRGKERKKDTPHPPKKTAPAPQPDKSATGSRGGFAITLDRALDDL
jgi:hypothetical protein